MTLVYKSGVRGLIARNLGQVKVAVPIIIVLLLASAAVAQDINLEATPFAGLRFGGNFKGTSSNEGQVSLNDLSIQSGFSYGLALDLRMSRQFDLELAYDRQSTELQATTDGQQQTLYFLNVDYLQLGLLYKFAQEGATLRPFLGATIGGTFLGPKAGTTGYTRFSFGLLGGVRHYFTSRVGLRAQGRLMLTQFSANDELFCADNECLNVSEGTAMNQFDFTAGLIITF